MINARFYQKNGRYFGFAVQGHAEYAEPGEDILCSAVSALSINTVNSLEKLTGDRLIVKEDDGKLYVRVSGKVSHESHILIKSLSIGLCEIYKEYGDEYVRVYFKEL